MRSTVEVEWIIPVAKRLTSPEKTFIRVASANRAFVKANGIGLRFKRKTKRTALSEAAKFVPLTGWFDDLIRARAHEIMKMPVTVHLPACLN